MEATRLNSIEATWLKQLDLSNSVGTILLKQLYCEVLQWDSKLENFPIWRLRIWTAKQLARGSDGELCAATNDRLMVHQRQFSMIFNERETACWREGFLKRFEAIWETIRSYSSKVEQEGTVRWWILISLISLIILIWWDYEEHFTVSREAAVSCEKIRWWVACKRERERD